MSHAEAKRARQEKLQRLKDDFEYYAPNCLIVLTKAGKVVPFEL